MNGTLLEAAKAVEKKAEDIRLSWAHYDMILDCSTKNGALDYGRAQGLDMAAEIIRSAIAKEEGEKPAWKLLFPGSPDYEWSVVSASDPSLRYSYSSEEEARSALTRLLSTPPKGAV